MRSRRVCVLVLGGFLALLLMISSVHAAEPDSVVEGRLDQARQMVDTQGTPHFDGKAYKPGANFAAVHEVVQEWRYFVSGQRGAALPTPHLRDL